jgi:hypothetical protein
MGAAIGHGVGVSGSQNEKEAGEGGRKQGKGCAVVARGAPADGQQSGIIPGRDRRNGREGAISGDNGP